MTNSNSIFTSLRISIVRILKYLLKPLEFRGKGTILLALCPKQGSINISLFGFSFNCDLSEHIQRNIFLFGYDRDAQTFIKKTLKLGDTFIDIGANVGFYSLLASSIVGSKGKVVAFEPNPKIFLKLMQTIKQNNISNIVTFNIGLGKARALLDLFIDSSAGNDTGTLVGQVGDKLESIKVEIVTLDEIIESLKIDRIHYLKIDVDGFEPDVFEGATNLLYTKKINVIQSEFCDHWLKKNGSSPILLHDFFTEAGFEDIQGSPVFLQDCIVDRYFINQGI